jgi:hypothetical protein
MLIWQMIKESKFVQALITFGIFLLGAFALIKKGESINQAKVKEEAVKRDEATEKRIRKANEKINSSNSSVTDWLHRNNRFRD